MFVSHLYPAVSVLSLDAGVQSTDGGTGIDIGCYGLMGKCDDPY